MKNAQLWRRAGPKVDLDDDRLNSYMVLGGLIGDTVRASGHDRLLMAPKLLSTTRVMAESASAEAVFDVRAVAAQIGWLELPAGSCCSSLHRRRTLSVLGRSQGVDTSSVESVGGLRARTARHVGDAYWRHLRTTTSGIS